MISFSTGKNVARPGSAHASTPSIYAITFEALRHFCFVALARRRAAACRLVRLEIARARRVLLPVRIA